LIISLATSADTARDRSKVNKSLRFLEALVDLDSTYSQIILSKLLLLAVPSTPTTNMFLNLVF